MVSFIMLHAQLYFLFVFYFPEMVAPYLKCIFVWGSIKLLFLFLFLMLSRMLPVSWQYHTVVSDHTVYNLSPHSGIIVLMLSRLLPVSWPGHTVVYDHTAPNTSPTTPNHTTIIHL